MTLHKRACIWIALGAGVYLFFSLTFLELPGLQYDEVNFANAALGRVEDSFIAWSYEAFGNRLPLMVMNYIGAVKSALYAPIFHFWGVSANTARLPVVLIGLLTLLFSYALFRDMFNDADRDSRTHTFCDRSNLYFCQPAGLGSGLADAGI